MAVSTKPLDTLSSIQKFSASAKTSLTKNATSMLASAHSVMDKYPPVKAFVYTLAGASAIPLVVFTVFALGTTALVLGVAGTGVTLIQGGFFAVASFVLFWFLAAALVIASVAGFWFTAGYFTYQVAQKVKS